MVKYTQDQKEIIKYLKGQIAGGNRYFKSKYIGADLGMSARSIGTNLYNLSQKCTTLAIIQWSKSDSKTWLVEPRTKRKTETCIST
jgi:hypothetical protein